MTLMLSGEMTSASKLTLTVHALCEFLDDPRCRSCQVLEICLTRIWDDVRGQHAAMSKDLLRKLRHVVPFAASHRRCEAQRCFPAEMLMAYLTPRDNSPTVQDEKEQRM